LRASGGRGWAGLGLVALAIGRVLVAAGSDHAEGELHRGRAEAAYINAGLQEGAVRGRGAIREEREEEVKRIRLAERGALSQVARCDRGARDRIGGILIKRAARFEEGVRIEAPLAQELAGLPVTRGDGGKEMNAGGALFPSSREILG
jgi:hypothetical protein